MRRARLAGLLALAALGPPGCAAVGLTGGAVTVAAMQASAGAALRAGTEYRLNGAAHRTFARPAGEVADGLRTALQRLAMPVLSETDVEDRREIVAEARDRVVEASLTPLTPAATALRLVVKQGFLRRDRATASEIIAQTERALLLSEVARPP